MTAPLKPGGRMSALQTKVDEYFMNGIGNVVLATEEDFVERTNVRSNYLVQVIGGGGRVVASGRGLTEEDAALHCLAALEEWRNQ